MNKQTLFIKENNQVEVFSFNKEFASNDLECNIYKLQQTQQGIFYLEYVSNNFDIPSKIFGNENKKAEKILNTFNDRNDSTGALFTGDKGSGKTLLAKTIANRCINEFNIPVILINQQFAPVDGLGTFLNDIGVSCVLFDEFFKTWGDKQDSLLTLFDGTFSTKRLMLLTENKEYKINEYYKERPGRIFYHFKYSKISEAVINEYCNENKIDKDKVNDIIEYSRVQTYFTFDTLKAIVEEIQRYSDENVIELIKDMNIGSDDNHGYDEFEIIKLESLDPNVIKTADQKIFNMRMFEECNIRYKYQNIHNPTENIAVRVCNSNGDNQLSENCSEDYSESVQSDSSTFWIGYDHIKYKKGDTYIFEIEGSVRVIANKKYNSENASNKYLKLLSSI